MAHVEMRIDGSSCRATRPRAVYVHRRHDRWPDGDETVLFMQRYGRTGQRAGDADGHRRQHRPPFTFMVTGAGATTWSWRTTSSTARSPVVYLAGGSSGLTSTSWIRRRLQLRLHIDAVYGDVHGTCRSGHGQGQVGQRAQRDLGLPRRPPATPAATLSPATIDQAGPVHGGAVNVTSKEPVAVARNGRAHFQSIATA